MTPSVAFSVILTTPQSFGWFHFIAALNTAVRVFRTKSFDCGERLTVVPVNAQASLSGTRPFGFVHVHSLVCSYNISIFVHGWWNFGSIASVNKRHSHHQQHCEQAELHFYDPQTASGNATNRRDNAMWAGTDTPVARVWDRGHALFFFLRFFCSQFCAPARHNACWHNNE